jgi:hypothetical protein
MTNQRKQKTPERIGLTPSYCEGLPSLEVRMTGHPMVFGKTVKKSSVFKQSGRVFRLCTPTSMVGRRVYKYKNGRYSFDAHRTVVDEIERRGFIMCPNGSVWEERADGTLLLCENFMKPCS